MVPPVEAPRPSITASPKRVDAKFPVLHAPDAWPDEFLSLNMFYGSASPSRSGGNERFETPFRGIVTEMVLDTLRLASSTFDDENEKKGGNGRPRSRFGEL